VNAASANVATAMARWNGVGVVATMID